MQQIIEVALEGRGKGLHRGHEQAVIGLRGWEAAAVGEPSAGEKGVHIVEFGEDAKIRQRAGGQGDPFFEQQYGFVLFAFSLRLHGRLRGVPKIGDGVANTSGLMGLAL